MADAVHYSKNIKQFYPLLLCLYLYLYLRRRGELVVVIIFVTGGQYETDLALSEVSLLEHASAWWEEGSHGFDSHRDAESFAELQSLHFGYRFAVYAVDSKRSLIEHSDGSLRLAEDSRAWPQKLPLAA